MTEHEETVLHYMKTLDLTREQAEALIVDDENDVTTELTPEQAKVAKEMRRSDRKKETTSRQRERKIDTDKRFLIDNLFTAIKNEISNEISVKNPEREIEFIFNSAHYSVTLTKHRKEKN